MFSAFSTRLFINLSRIWSHKIDFYCKKKVNVNLISFEQTVFIRCPQCYSMRIFYHLNWVLNWNHHKLEKSSAQFKNHYKQKNAFLLDVHSFQILFFLSFGCFKSEFFTSIVIIHLPNFKDALLFSSQNAVHGRDFLIEFAQGFQ